MRPARSGARAKHEPLPPPDEKAPAVR